MSMLWNRCNWLHARLEGFLGAEGQETRVVIVECPPLELPTNWRAWSGWIDDPTPFTDALAYELKPLLGTVNAIQAIRAELERPGWPSAVLRDNFRLFFEDEFVKRHWLVGEGISDLGCY